MRHIFYHESFPLKVSIYMIKLVVSGGHGCGQQGGRSCQQGGQGWLWRGAEATSPISYVSHRRPFLTASLADGPQVGKMLLSSGTAQLGLLCYVPASKLEKCNASEWMKATLRSSSLSSPSLPPSLPFLLPSSLPSSSPLLPPPPRSAACRVALRALSSSRSSAPLRSLLFSPPPPHWPESPSPHALP